MNAQELAVLWQDTEHGAAMVKELREWGVTDPKVLDAAWGLSVRQDVARKDLAEFDADLAAACGEEMLADVRQMMRPMWEIRRHLPPDLQSVERAAVLYRARKLSRTSIVKATRYLFRARVFVGCGPGSCAASCAAQYHLKRDLLDSSFCARPGEPLRENPFWICEFPPDKENPKGRFLPIFMGHIAYVWNLDWTLGDAVRSDIDLWGTDVAADEAGFVAEGFEKTEDTVTLYWGGDCVIDDDDPNAPCKGRHEMVFDRKLYEKWAREIIDYYYQNEDRYVYYND